MKRFFFLFLVLAGSLHAQIINNAGGGGGSGTVTSASVVTSNGVSATVANPTTTPAFTFTLGAITPTTVDGLTITTTTGTFTLANAKTFVVNNGLTLSGTDSTTMTFPSTSATIARTDAANTFTGASSTTSWNETTPKIITGLNDTNGNSMLAFTPTASAVDGFTVTNAAAANPATVTLSATGSDSNITLALTPKGTGVTNIGGHVTIEGVTSTGATGTGALVFASGTPALNGATLNNITAIGGSDLGFQRNAAGVMEVDNATGGQWAALKLGVRDGGTNSTANGLTVGHQTTGTATTGFGTAILLNADDNGAVDQSAAKIQAAWSTATNTSQVSYLDFQVVNLASLGSKMRLSGAGGLSVGATVDPGSGVINANTGFQIGNAATGQTVLASNGTNFVATNVGAWDGIVRVTGSNATTTGQSLVDITGLVTPTLLNSTQYEIEAVLLVSTTAVTTGTEYGIHGAGTGTAATTNAIITGTLATNTAQVLTISAVDTATAAFLTTSAENGTITIKGFVTTTSTGTSTISIQHLKATSGTSTVFIGSILKYRKA